MPHVISTTNQATTVNAAHNSAVTTQIATHLHAVEFVCTILLFTHGSTEFLATSSWEAPTNWWWRANDTKGAALAGIVKKPRSSQPRKTLTTW